MSCNFTAWEELCVCVCLNYELKQALQLYCSYFPTATCIAIMDIKIHSFMHSIKVHNEEKQASGMRVHVYHKM